MMVVLLEGSGDEPKLTERVLNELRALGITSIGVLRDRRTIGVVLEGWAFEPARAGDAAAAAVGGSATARALQPLVQMAVVPASSQGGLP
jgi:hypothetical protein